MIADLKLLLRRFERHLSAGELPSITEGAPQSVFHYTSASGFAGIVSERSLRATNFSFMNDPSEVGYGRSVVEQVLRNQKLEPRSCSEHLIRRTLANVKTQVLSEIYVCCFTTLIDDISQWRAYGSAAAARYCIGFNADIIRRLTTRLPDTIFDRVVHSLTTQIERVSAVVARAIEFAETQHVSPADVEPVAEIFASSLVRLICLLKSPAYHAEEEWRVITVKTRRDVGGIEFDSSRGTIKPYLRIGLQHRGQLPITSVYVLAPSRPDSAVKAADLMLRAAGSAIAPRYSQVPYAE